MADAWGKFEREMARLERAQRARERQERKPNGSKQNFNIDRQFPSWPGDEPNPANVIPVGMGIEPEDAVLDEEPTDIASMFTVRDDSDPGAGARTARRQDEEALRGGPDNIRRRIGGEAPAYQSGVMTYLEGQTPAELPTLEEARANAIRYRTNRLEDARFGLEAGTLGPFEPAIVAISEGIRDQRPDRLPGANMQNALEGLNYALLADPSTGRRDPVSRRNYDYQYGAPWGANEPGEDGLTDDQRANQRNADRMDPNFLGEDEITITASSRPESFGEAAVGLLTQDSWETPEARRQGLANPFLAVGDFATDLWTMPGQAQEEQAAREAGAMFDYGMSGRESDLRRAQVAAAEYGVNSATSAVELTPAGFAGDIASLGRVGARSGARQATETLPARRIGDDAPMGFEGAPRPQAEPIDAEFRPAPQRAFQAAVRDPETGRTYTGLDHMEAIDSAPDAATRARLEQIYNAPTEDPNAVGFVVNGQFMSREDGLQALRAQRRPVSVGEQVNRDGSVTPADPIDWDAPVAPERSALRDLGLGAAVGAGAGFGADALLNQEANADNGEEGDGGEPLLPILGGIAGAALASRGGRNMRSQVNMFAGPNARTADRAALTRAQEMAASGASRDEIWANTGWFQGVDGKWRFEIDDSGATVAMPARAPYVSELATQYARENFGVNSIIDLPVNDIRRQEAMQWAQTKTPSIADQRAQSWPLNDVLDHPEMRAAYGLDDVSFGREMDAGLQGSYSPTTKRVRATDESAWLGGPEADPRSTVLHEVQHYTQETEGFARGGDPRAVYEDEITRLNARMTALVREQDTLRSIINGGNTGVDTAPYAARLEKAKAEYRAVMAEREALADPKARMDGYRRLAGETEARNVQTRRDFTPEERRARPPWETQDVPDDQQIIRFDGTRAESRPWTEADITRAQEMRAEGATVRAIGEELGRAPGDVSRRLSAGLAPPKARGFDPRLSPDEGYAAQRRLAGLTPAQIADEMELPSGQVRVALHQARRKAPDLSIPSIAIGAGIGGTLAFGDEAYAQLAGEDSIIEIAGMQIDTNGEPPSFRTVQGEPTVSGEYVIYEFSDGSRHAFRMDRSGDRLNPEYVGELIGTNTPAPRLGEGMGRPLSGAGVTETNLPPPMESDGFDAELNDETRIGGTLTAGLLARLMARRAGLRGVAGEIPGAAVAFGVNRLTGGDPVEAAILSGATPFAGRLGEYGALRAGQAIDDTFYAPGQIARDNERLMGDRQFIARRNEFAQTLPSAAPRARRLGVERDPLDGYASGRDPNGRVADATEVIEQGYFRDAAPQALSPRVEFDSLPPVEQLAWMDRVGFDAPRAPAAPDRGNMGYVDGSTDRPPWRPPTNPFMDPTSGRSWFDEEPTPRKPRAPRQPPPPLAERAAQRGAQGAMQPVKVATMRAIADDLGIPAEGVKATDLRRTLVRELGRQFDSTAEMVAFLRRYGVTAAALGIGLGGAQMVTEPEVRM